MSRGTAITAVAATGQLGTGYKEETLARAVEGAAFIGCDAGSTDPGPYYLGSGKSQASPQAIKRDLRHMLRLALEHDIPVIVGSAGTAGGTPHLQGVLEIVRELARENRWHFKLAALDSELDKDMLAEAHRRGRIRPLDPAPELDEDTILGAERVVGMMGIEPIQRALEAKAQVIVGGRCSDVSVFAALPVSRGIPKGIAFHAGKILECGAASVTHRLYPDSMVAHLDERGFLMEPPNEAMRCTPQSVNAHMLYENADPYRLVEPGGVLDTTCAVHTAASDRTVRVEGSRFDDVAPYTVRLEGAALVGYRSATIAGIRDPLVLRQLDRFLQELDAVVERKVRDSLELERGDYRLTWRVYGANGVMGALEPTPAIEGHEVGLLIDVVSQTQARSNAIASIAWHTGLHHPIPEYQGLISSFAFPFSPPNLEGGPVYRFMANHVLELDDPCGPFSMALEDL